MLWPDRQRGSCDGELGGVGRAEPQSGTAGRISGDTSHSPCAEEQASSLHVRLPSEDKGGFTAVAGCPQAQGFQGWRQEGGEGAMK